MNLKVEKHIARENEKRIPVMKWRDKREVLLLSQKDTDNFQINKNKRGVEKYTPKIIHDYNEAKSAVNLSDSVKCLLTRFLSEEQSNGTENWILNYS